ncbi:MAG: hypothetical protein ABIL37_03275 [candidate division WOR-3 bacterium]
MAILLLSQVVFKAESVEIYLKGIGKLKGVNYHYISQDKYRLDENLVLDRERLVSKLMEKYYAGEKSIILDLTNDSVYRVDHNERSYYVYKLDSYVKPVEKFDEKKKDLKAKVIIKNLGNCNYEIKFSFENDSIVSRICYKEVEANNAENQFFINYNKKLKSDADMRVLQKLGFFSINNPFVKFLMGDIVKKSDLEKITKIKGYPYIIDVSYYNDTSLVYKYFSKLISLEVKENVDVFKIDTTYKRR